MSTELLLFGVLPTVVAVGAVVVSWLVSRRARSFAHWCASVLVFLTVAWSLLILYRIFLLGAWPIYLPYFVIGLTVLIVIIQALLLRRSRV
jgi:hypothetical protein